MFSSSMPTSTYIEYLEEKLAEEESRNAVFEKCLERGLKLWQAEHPEADYWIDGSQNIKWLLEKIYLLESIKTKRYKQTLQFLAEFLDVDDSLSRTSIFQNKHAQELKQILGEYCPSWISEKEGDE